MDGEFAEDTQAWHHLTTEDSLEAHHQQIADNRSINEEFIQVRKDRLNKAYTNGKIGAILSKQQYCIFELMFKLQKTVPEIAEILQIQQQAVNTQIDRFSNKLQIFFK